MTDEQHAQVVQDNLALIDRNHDLELELDMCKKALGELEKRLMPEGCEWPRYEDNGELVELGENDSLEFHKEGVTYWHGSKLDPDHDHLAYGERVKRPAVLAADGEPLEVGQTVWDENGDELVIGAIEDGGHTVTCRYADVGDSIPTHGMWSPSDLTHQRPVLDADGVPIKVGDTVYDISDGTELVITSTKLDKLDHVKAYQEKQIKASVSIHPLRLTHQRPVLDADGVPIRVDDEVYGTVEGGPFIVTEVSDKGSVFVDAFPDTGMHGSMFTHTKPEPPDSWERIEEDTFIYPKFYCEWHGIGATDDDELRTGMISDIVRRCKALSEKGAE